MITKGIRIRDRENHMVKVKLCDILNEISDGDKFHWSILFSEVIPMPGRGKYTTSIEEKADNAQEGYILTWQQLKDFTGAVHQELDLRVIGALDVFMIRKYNSDEELHRNCDFLIEMFDSTYWEVFSRDHELIDRLAKKFKDTEFLTPDWNSRKNSKA